MTLASSGSINLGGKTAGDTRSILQELLSANPGRSTLIGLNDSDVKALRVSPYNNNITYPQPTMPGHFWGAAAISTISSGNFYHWPNANQQSAATYTVKVGANGTLSYLLVGGGGGGGSQVGSSYSGAGGGGGGGEVKTGTISVTANDIITITVGAGGSASSAITYYSRGGDGGDTIISSSAGSTVTAKGGKGARSGGAADLTAGDGGNLVLSNGTVRKQGDGFGSDAQKLTSDDQRWQIGGGGAGFAGNGYDGWANFIYGQYSTYRALNFIDNQAADSITVRKTLTQKGISYSDDPTTRTISRFRKGQINTNTDSWDTPIFGPSFRFTSIIDTSKSGFVQDYFYNSLSPCNFLSYEFAYQESAGSWYNSSYPRCFFGDSSSSNMANGFTNSFFIHPLAQPSRTLSNLASVIGCIFTFKAKLDPAITPPAIPAYVPDLAIGISLYDNSLSFNSQSWYSPTVIQSNNIVANRLIPVVNCAGGPNPNADPYSTSYYPYADCNNYFSGDVDYEYLNVPSFSKIKSDFYGSPYATSVTVGPCEYTLGGSPTYCPVTLFGSCDTMPTGTVINYQQSNFFSTTIGNDTAFWILSVNHENNSPTYPNGPVNWSVTGPPNRCQAINVNVGGTSPYTGGSGGSTDKNFFLWYGEDSARLRIQSIGTGNNIGDDGTDFSLGYQMLPYLGLSTHRLDCIKGNYGDDIRVKFTATCDFNADLKHYHIFHFYVATLVCDSQGNPIPNQPIHWSWIYLGGTANGGPVGGDLGPGFGAGGCDNSTQWNWRFIGGSQTPGAIIHGRSPTTYNSVKSSAAPYVPTITQPGQTETYEFHLDDLIRTMWQSDVDSISSNGNIIKITGIEISIEAAWLPSFVAGDVAFTDLTITNFSAYKPINPSLGKDWSIKMSPKHFSNAITDATNGGITLPSVDPRDYALTGAYIVHYLDRPQYNTNKGFGSVVMTVPTLQLSTSNTLEGTGRGGDGCPTTYLSNDGTSHPFQYLGSGGPGGDSTSSTYRSPGTWIASPTAFTGNVTNGYYNSGVTISGWGNGGGGGGFATSGYANHTVASAGANGFVALRLN